MQTTPAKTHPAQGPRAHDALQENASFVELAGNTTFPEYGYTVGDGGWLPINDPHGNIIIYDYFTFEIESVEVLIPGIRKMTLVTTQYDDDRSGGP